jgi:hypothetical protein
MTDLSVSAFKEIEAKKALKLKQTYDRYLKKCYTYILERYKRSGITQSEYRLPPVSFSNPLFNMDECVEYLKVNFTAMNIVVTRIGETILLIDWSNLTSKPNPTPPQQQTTIVPFLTPQAQPPREVQQQIQRLEQQLKREKTQIQTQYSEQARELAYPHIRSSNPNDILPQSPPKISPVLPENYSTPPNLRRDVMLPPQPIATRVSRPLVVSERPSLQPAPAPLPPSEQTKSDKRAAVKIRDYDSVSVSSKRSTTTTKNMRLLDDFLNEN